MKKFIWISIFAAAALAAVLCFSGFKNGDQKDNVVRVGMDAGYPPFGSQNVDTKDYEGFDVDIINAIGEEEGFKPEIKNISFDGLIPSLNTNAIDLIINDLTVTEERKVSVDFSERYCTVGMGVVVRGDYNLINDAKDLEGKTLGVSIASTGEEAARHVKNANVKVYNAISDAFIELKNGGVDAVVNDTLTNDRYVSSQKDGSVKTTKISLNNEDLAIAVKKGNSELLKKINDGLVKIKKNGKYAQIYKKWFGVEPADELLK
jgi:hypothetical protein